MLSVLCHTFGAIAAGGLCIYLLMSPERRARAWVSVIPLSLWIIWWVWALQFDQGIASASNLPGAPLYAIRSAGAAIAALTGTGPSFGGRADWLEGVVEVLSSLVAVAGIVWLAARIRRGLSTSWLWSYLAIAGAFWFGTALAENAFRQPSTPRYVFFGAIIVVLIVAEALRGRSISRHAITGLLAVFCVAMVGNGIRLGYGASRLVSQTTAVDAQLAMIELAGVSARPTFNPRTVAPRGSFAIAAPAGALVAFMDDAGSLGYTLEEVREGNATVREDADLVLARALGLIAVPVKEPEDVRRSSCRTISADPEAPARIPLQAGTQLLRLDGGTAQPLLLGRFGDVASAEVGLLEPGSEVALELPGDDAPDPWFATVTGAIRVCPVAPDS